MTQQRANTTRAVIVVDGQRQGHPSLRDALLLLLADGAAERLTLGHDLVVVGRQPVGGAQLGFPRTVQTSTAPWNSGSVLSQL